MYVSFVYLSTSLLYVHALVFLAHIYVDLIVSATNVLVVFLSTINKHFLLLLIFNSLANEYGKSIVTTGCCFLQFDSGLDTLEHTG